MLCRKLNSTISFTVRLKVNSYRIHHRLFQRADNFNEDRQQGQRLQKDTLSCLFGSLRWHLGRVRFGDTQSSQNIHNQTKRNWNCHPKRTKKLQLDINSIQTGSWSVTWYRRIFDTASDWLIKFLGTVKRRNNIFFCLDSIVGWS